MQENTLTIVINKPIDEVFEFTTNPKKTQLWVQFIDEEISNIFPPKVGTEYKSRRGDSWNVSKVTEYETNKRFKLENETFSVRYSYRSITENITELTYLESVKKGKLTKPFTQEVLEHLKSIIETRSKIFLIHGAFGNPEENWFPWLKKELEMLGHEVIAPTFPTPDNQSLDSWKEVFSTYSNQINENTIFVGHSLAPAFILDILEHKKIKAAFFVSGFLQLLGNETFDSINKTFVDRSFDWDAITSNCKRFFVFHSDNDPYVPISCAEELSNKLSVELKLIPGAGHFNKSARYTEFQILLDDIKKML